MMVLGSLETPPPTRLIGQRARMEMPIVTNIIRLPQRNQPSHDLEDIEALAHFLTWARDEAQRLGLRDALVHMDRALAEMDRPTGP